MREDNILTLVMIVMILLFLMIFVIDYINLEKFKACYDISFQDKICEKYIDY